MRRCRGSPGSRPGPLRRGCGSCARSRPRAEPRRAPRGRRGAPRWAGDATGHGGPRSDRDRPVCCPPGRRGRVRRGDLGAGRSGVRAMPSLPATVRIFVAATSCARCAWAAVGVSAQARSQSRRSCGARARATGVCRSSRPMSRQIHRPLPLRQLDGHEVARKTMSASCSGGVSKRWVKAQAIEPRGDFAARSRPPTASSTMLEGGRHPAAPRISPDGPHRQNPRPTPSECCRSRNRGRTDCRAGRRPQGGSGLRVLPEQNSLNC